MTREKIYEACLEKIDKSNCLLLESATGTGKTITLEVLAEGFSDLGVPVFLADVKGDISGMCHAGSMNEGLQKRLTKMGLENDFEFNAFPVRFWDVYGEAGHPVRPSPGCHRSPASDHSGPGLPRAYRRPHIRA